MLSEILMQTETDPYPGLRAFTAEESHLFFGRDEQIDKLLEKLDQSHFVAVVGPSGCGKSSLVKAGLIPALKTGFFLNTGTKWRIAQMRPGNEPYKNLAATLLQPAIDTSTIDCLKAELKRSPKGLLNVIETENLYNKENFLLIVDQFEELFRYQQNNNIDEVTGFINLLIESATQQKIPVYIIITMRSDFLGQCSLFLGLPEILNDNQFLTPRLTREQTKEAIEGPASVCGGSIEPKLVNNLLNDIGIDHDQLPLLQHALMRMWNLAAKKKTGNDKNDPANNSAFELNKNSVVLTLDDYNKTGKLNEALSQHANEILDGQLTDQQRKIAEVLFKRLSERNAEQKDNRRLATVEDVAKVAKVSVEEVINVADIFRASENSFLMPPPEVKLTAQSFIDISHESLLRRWDRMKIWIEKEYADASEFKKLAEDANDYFKENGELLTGIKLINVVRWRDQRDINENWAFRYSDNYKEVEEYIRKSKIKSRKKNVLLTAAVCISIFSIITALSFVVYNTAVAQKKIEAIKINNEINRKIDSTAAQATKQKEIDLTKAQAAKLKAIDSINFQNNAQRKIDLANAEIAVQRKIDASSAERKIASINFKRKEDSLNAEIEKKVAIDSANTVVNSVLDHLQEILGLVNEPFYKSAFLDSSSRNEYIRQLVTIKYRDENNDKYKALLNNLNTAVTINEAAQKDPNAALVKALHFDSAVNNKLSNYTLSKISNNYFFYNQEVNLHSQYGTSNVFALSPSRHLFAVKNNDTLKVFGFNGNKISLLQNVTIKKGEPDRKKNHTFYPDVKPAALRFVSENLLIAFINNYIYKLDFATRQIIANPTLFLKSRQNEFSNTSAISPDGKKIVIDFGNNSLRIWDIDNMKKLPQLISLNSPGAVQNILFSNDGKKLIVNQTDNCNFIDLLAPGIQKIYKYATFTTDSNYAIFQPRLVSVFELHDINDSTKTATINFSDLGINTFDSAKINSVSLSPDFKALIIQASSLKNNQMNTYYYRKNDSDLIFQFKVKNAFKDSGSLVAASYLNNSVISFIDSNNLVGLNNTNDNVAKIQWWEKFGDNSNDKGKLNFFISSIKSSAQNNQQSEDYNAFINSLTGEEELTNAALLALHQDSVQLTKETLGNAKILFGKLATINSKKYLPEYRTLSRNYFNYYRDTLNYISDLKQVISIELILKDTSESGKQNLSSDYWALSWYSLFFNQYNNAIICAQKCAELNKTDNGANTNLALGYLLSGQCENANKVYIKYKDSSYLSDYRKFNDAFLQDLIDLENAGIITRQNKILYEHVERIRAFLKGDEDTLDCDN